MSKGKRQKKPLSKATVALLEQLKRLRVFGTCQSDS